MRSFLHDLILTYENGFEGKIAIDFKLCAKICASMNSLDFSHAIR